MCVCIEGGGATSTCGLPRKQGRLTLWVDTVEVSGNICVYLCGEWLGGEGRGQYGKATTSSFGCPQTLTSRKSNIMLKYAEVGAMGVW